MNLKSYWWVSVPVLLVVVVAVTLWTHRPAALSKPSTPAQPAAASTPRPEPDTPQATAAAAAATDERAGESLVECMLRLPRLLVGVIELAEQGIALSMGAATGDASVRIPWSCRDVPIPPVIALTPNGAEPLSGDVTRAESKLESGCEEAVRGVALTAPRPLEEGDLPIALGAQAAKFLQWIPAKPVDGATACAPPRPEFARQKQQLFELPGREGRWSLEFWERMQQPTQPSPAAGDAVAQSKGALVGSRDDSVIRIFRLSRVAADGTCSLSAMTQQDSDGQYINGWPPLSKAFGLLSLPVADPLDEPAADTPAADEPAERAWMILETPGYKQRAVSAIPLAADGVTLMIESRDSVFYSGC
jgi:hypothetical protein